MVGKEEGMIFQPKRDYGLWSSQGLSQLPTLSWYPEQYCTEP